MSLEELKEIIRELSDQDRHELSNFISELDECERSDYWSVVRWQLNADSFSHDDHYSAAN